MSKYPKPTGGRRDEMTQEPRAWPQVSEDTLRERSSEFREIRRRLFDVLLTFEAKKTAIFNRNSWFGSASAAAELKVQTHIDKLSQLDRQLDAAIQFYDKAADAVENVKERITAATNAAQDKIDDYEDQSADDGKDRKDLIDQLVSDTFLSNSKDVQNSAAGLGPPASPDTPGQTPGVAGTPTPVNQPGNPSPGDKPQFIWNRPQQNLPTPDASPTTGGSGPGPNGQPQFLFDRPHQDSPHAPAGDSRPNHDVQNNNGPTVYPGRPDGGRPTTPTSSTMSPPMIGGSVGTPGTPSSGGSGPTPSGLGGDAGRPDLSKLGQRDNQSANQNPQNNPLDAKGPLTPQDQQQMFVNDISKGLAAGSQVPQQIPLNPTAGTGQVPLTPHPETPVATPPAPATGPSVPSAGSGGFGGGASGGGMGAAPVSGPAPAPTPPPMPLAPPATPPPAGPTGGTGSAASGTNAGGNAPTGPSVHAASTTAASQAAQAAPAPIPVSAARMERDAMASAATAAAIRRQKNGGNDPLTIARRIAAALNVGVMDFGFFWVTGLCADGTIVVANSYGLAYIPESVNLPPQVHLATADESIPPHERAKWSTYPMLAVQGWAQAHSQKLRAVIATEQQFANFDPGAAKVVLQPDDIPDTGKMEGRSRLEVISPGAAAKLASVSDTSLVDLLPPAFTDSEAPEDLSSTLWFDICKPLMSTMPDRWVAHLEAFLAYTEHAQELALHRALTATDPKVQRTAIANWVYWQHLSVLVSDALSADVSV